MKIRNSTSSSLPRRWRALHELRTRGVRLLTETRVSAITREGVETIGPDGERRLEGTDSVIITSGAEANPSLADTLAGLAPEVHLLGDASGVGYIEGAILDAARIARDI